MFDHEFFRTEIIDWTQDQELDKLGISPNLILGTDVVFDGSPYYDFVKLCQQCAEQNQKVKVLVVMPTEHRKCANHFIQLM